MEFIDTNLNTLTDMFPFNDGSRPVLRQGTWIAVTFVSYVIGFNLLSKFAKAHLIHEALPKINQYRLKIALWRIVFALWAIVLYFACVWDSNEGNLIHVILQAAAPKCTATSLNVSKRNVYSELALFTAPVSFFLHQIYVSISSFTEPAVTSMGGLSLFVCLCNFIDCQKFCLHILFLLGLNVGTLEVARTIYALRSRCKGFDGPPPSAFLRCMALPVFIIHLLTWMLINFYLFPKTYFSLPSATDIEPSARTATVYINLFIIIFAKVQFFDSPAWSLVKLVVKKPSALGRASGWKSLPMIVLLPYSSSLLPELKTIQLKFLMNALPTSAERRIIRRKIMSGESQTSAPISEGKANLLSFIKCVKILKRKMRHRYEQKTANETENMSQEEYEHKLMEEDLDENAAGSSQGQDVTDLFFSVPSLQDGMSAARHETSITDLGTSADVDASSIRNETGSSKAISEAGSTPLKQNEEEKHRRLTESDKESQD